MTYPSKVVLALMVHCSFPFAAFGQSSGSLPNNVPTPQRAILYEEDPNNEHGNRFAGTVLWRPVMRTQQTGAPELGIRADVEIPDRKMTMTWLFRQNNYPKLPASHTIEIQIKMPQDAENSGVHSIPGLLMKQDEGSQGVPLAGTAATVRAGYFLIGLSPLEADRQSNLQLLKERPWFDVPLFYNNNRRAILALEKGTSGEQAFNEALAAWSMIAESKPQQISPVRISPPIDPIAEALKREEAKKKVEDKAKAKAAQQQGEPQPQFDPTKIAALLDKREPTRPDSAADSSIDYFVNSQGGCEFVKRGWEQQFRRKDLMPFEKRHVEWTPSDYAQIRSWIVRCLDPLIAVPGRREVYLSNVDARLNSFQRTQQELLERVHQQQLADKARTNRTIAEAEAAKKVIEAEAAKKIAEAEAARVDIVSRELREMAEKNALAEQEAAALRNSPTQYAGPKRDILGIYPGMMRPDADTIAKGNGWKCAPTMFPVVTATTRMVPSGTSLSCPTSAGKITWSWGKTTNIVLEVELEFQAGGGIDEVAKSVSRQFGATLNEIRPNSEDPARDYLARELGIGRGYKASLKSNAELSLTVGDGMLPSGRVSDPGFVLAIRSPRALENEKEAVRQNDLKQRPTPRF